MDLTVREQLIEGRVQRHDRNHFEVKLDYSIDPDRRWTRYRVEAWLFAPRSLGVDKATYTKEQFYADVSGYIRFKTPTVALTALTRHENSDSPLIRLEELLPELLKGSHDERSRKSAGRELRILGCLLRAELRERTLRIIERLEELPAGAEGGIASDIARDADTFVDELHVYMDRFRTLRSEMEHPSVPSWLAELYHHLDEYQSLAVETVVTLLLDAMDTAAKTNPDVAGPRSKLTEIIRQEQGRRSAQGLPSVLRDLAPDEGFVYRRSLLKRVVMSALYLETHTEREGRRLGEVGAAMAAGAAMAFAVAAAVFSQARWGLNTMPFFIAAVASYIMKDRIKEWLRNTFRRGLSRFLWDHSVHIRDPESDAIVGECREAVAFMSMDDVPPEILRLRHDKPLSPLDRTRKPEVVIRYEKSMGLRGRTIASHHGRLKDISDIIRWDISRFLVRADDPKTEELVYDPESDEVRRVACPKVYHLNVLFVLRAGKGSEVIASQRGRVVLDQRGIRRLEEA